LATERSSGSDNEGEKFYNIACRCYLKLGNVSELPDAEQRLAECEKAFAKCYGQNMERLNSVRGSSRNEMVLLLRLRLLEAIVAFHNGHNQRAVQLVRTPYAF
jgi:hypothetical protein